MTFASATLRMRDSLYAKLGIEILWTPQGAAEAIALTALPALADQVSRGIPGFPGGMVTQGPGLKIRMSELADAAPGLEFKKGERITIGAVAYEINAAPMFEDLRREEVTLTLGTNPR